jgi:cell division protein FtsX
MLNDGLILAGMVAADALILTVWWFLGSRLVPAESDPLAGESNLRTTPRLHRILTVVCALLLIGLLVECMAMFPAILVRFGWS